MTSDGDHGTARATRQVSDPAGPAEREAARFAASVVGGQAGVGPISASPDVAGRPGPAGLPLGSGRPLARTDQRFFENRLGGSLAGVRLHDGAPAAALTRQYRAAALTSGQQIAFGPHQPAPDTPAGRRLLAHELAHVVQQQRQPTPTPVIHRQVAVPSGPVSPAVPHNVATFVLDPALASSSPPNMTTHLRVVDPWAPTPSPRESFVAIERQVRRVSTIRIWAVPLIELFDNPAEASSTVVAESPRVAPVVEDGQLVWTNRGEFTVTGTAGSLAFSDSPVPEAVAAAAVLLAETDIGSVLVDSGQQLLNGSYAEPVGTEVARRVVTLMPVGQVDEAILMPGAPSGHSLPQIALQVAIGAVRATAEQYLDPKLRDTVTATQRNQASYRQALETQLRTSLLAGRSDWEATQPIAPNESLRRQRWQQHLDQLVTETLGRVGPTAALTAESSGSVLQLPEAPAAPAAGPAEPILDRSAVNWEPADDEVIMVVGGGRLGVLNSRGLLLRPLKQPLADIPGSTVRPTGPTGPTPIGARPPTPWVAAAAVGKAGQSMVRTNRGPGVLVDAGGAEAFLPQQAITRMISDLGLTTIDLIVVTHPHADHVRALLDAIVEHNIAARDLITSANWNEAGVGPLNKVFNALRNTTDQRLIDLGYGRDWRPGVAVGNAGVSHATLRVDAGQVDIFTNPAAHNQIRDDVAAGNKVSGATIDSSSLFYVMGNETSPHRVAVLGDLRGTDILRFAGLPDGSFQRALAGVRVIVGFGHHLGPDAGTTAEDVRGYELLFRETLLRNGELTIVVQSSADFAFGTDQATPNSTNAILEFARSMGARVVFVGEPGTGTGGAVVRSDLTVGSYGQGVQSFAGNEQVQSALERLQLLREASRALTADPVAGPRQLRLDQSAAEIQTRLAPEISRLETLLADLLGRRAADLFDARGRRSADTKAQFRADRSKSGLTVDQLNAQLAQQGPLESSLQNEVVDQLRQAVRHASPLAVEAELLHTPREVSEAIAQLPQQQRETLERQYREINEISAAVTDGKTPPEKQLELLQRAEALRDDLRRATEAAPADARPAIEGETRRLQQVIDSLMRNVEVRSVTGRDEQGRVTKTEFRTLRRPSDLVDRSFARAGQLMGAMMVVHSVQDLATSMAGFQSGQVNLPETAFQVAHAGYNLNIGLRMVRLAPVHPGEFVAVAALEVGAVLFSDTGTEEERDYRLATIGVEQLCLAAGMAVMHGGSLLPHPAARAIVMGLGLAITLAGPRVLSWLGLDAWLVRVTNFRPGSVTHVFQDIQDTLDEYQTIIGAGGLAERSDEQLRAVGASDPAALRQQAGEARSRHTERAHRKEQELIGLFRAAYQDAGTSYTGLRDLDAMAARFARLRHLALPADANRAAVQSDFASMDPDNAALSNATPEQIRDMDQWTRLYRELNNLDNALRASPVKWPPIYEYLDKCREIMDNARYRVDSAAAGYRPDPMIRKGTPGYAEYVNLLSSYERRYGRLMARLAELGGAGYVYRLPDSDSWDHQTGDPLAAVTLLQSLRSAYDQRVDEAATELPELSSPEVWRDSNVLMHRLEAAHLAHPNLFNRLRISELALQASIGQARTALSTAADPSPAMPDLIARETAAAELAIRERRVAKGLVFPDEMDSELTERRAIEDRTLAARIDAAHPRAGLPSTGPRPVPLSESEITALHSDELSGQGARMTSTEHQLARAWEMLRDIRSIDLTGPFDPSLGHRLERELLKVPGPKVWIYHPGFFDSTDHLDVPAGRAIIVARVGADISGRTSILSGPARYARVLAITPAAVDLLGSEPTYVRLHHEDLQPLAAGELEQRDPAAPPLPVPAGQPGP